MHSQQIMIEVMMSLVLLMHSQKIMIEIMMSLVPL